MRQVFGLGPAHAQAAEEPFTTASTSTHNRCPTPPFGALHPSSADDDDDMFGQTQTLHRAATALSSSGRVASLSTDDGNAATTHIPHSHSHLEPYDVTPPPASADPELDHRPTLMPELPLPTPTMSAATSTAVSSAPATTDAGQPPQQRSDPDGESSVLEESPIEVAIGTTSYTAHDAADGAADHVADHGADHGADGTPATAHRMGDGSLAALPPIQMHASGGHNHSGGHRNKEQVVKSRMSFEEWEAKKKVRRLYLDDIVCTRFLGVCLSLLSSRSGDLGGVDAPHPIPSLFYINPNFTSPTTPFCIALGQPILLQAQQIVRAKKAAHMVAAKEMELAAEAKRLGSNEAKATEAAEKYKVSARVFWFANWSCSRMGS
jgi:hypothetical protein